MNVNVMKKLAKTDIKIGLEVHCQLTNLKTKLFCGCNTSYRGKEPNSLVCPVCMGLPGTLPVLNEKALQDAIMLSLAINANISDKTSFFRKNYFYPDMPKNFQISQYDKAGGIPLASEGHIMLDDKKIRIRRIQLEEDPGKLSYEGTIESSSYALVDYNRAGISLLEVVTEPDMNSPKEARIFVEKLRSILEHLEISDGSLEGSMRSDANISLSGGKRVEIKNISSFKEIERALNFEITRQRSLISRGIRVGQETRHWDETRRITISLRTKEEEEDYRYFPEPDLVPLLISKNQIKKIQMMMPELPDSRNKRFIDQYNLTPQNAEILTREKNLADFFEESAKSYNNYREISNWLTGDLQAYMNSKNLGINEIKITTIHLTELLKLNENGIISRKIAKSILYDMLSSGKMPDVIIKEKGFVKITNKNFIEQIVEKTLHKNFRAAKDALVDKKAINYLMGLVMKESQGKIDPNLANRILKNKLSEMKKTLLSKKV
jgi:aspartyl-tRNA(Asn)/glutamyl-tRNA(Gln) amidotransferase subunit B